MSNIQTTENRIMPENSARRAALDPFTNDRWDGGRTIDGWFDAIRQEREERARIRRESQAMPRLRGLVQNGNFEREALKMAEKVERIRQVDPARAVKLHTQYVVIAQMRGLDQDCTIDAQPVEEPAVFDRTPAGHRLGGYRPQSESTNPSFGSIVRRMEEVEYQQSLEQCLTKLREGANPKKLGKGKGAGRNSNAWNRAVMDAIEIYAAEQDAARMSADHPSNIEHEELIEGTPEEQAEAERLAAEAQAEAEAAEAARAEAEAQALARGEPPPPTGTDAYE